MNQSVMVFASTTARDADLTAPTEGMIVWLQDANKFVYYTGTAWADVVPSNGTGNAIINGAFDINQRSFTSVTGNGVYSFDRWKHAVGSAGGTSTVTPQVFTPGTAPVTGYESANFMQIVSASQAGASDWSGTSQLIEDVRSFANQTVTISFWAKAATGTPKVGVTFEQGFGTGGSATVYTTGGLVTLTTSWARYSVTATIPSIAGKTIGTSSFLAVYLLNSTGTTLTGLGFANTGLQNGTFSYWGVQLEAGSVATPFKRNAPSIQAERATARGYLASYGGSDAYEVIGSGNAQNTTQARIQIPLTSPMRTAPTSTEYSTLALYDGVTIYAVTGILINGAGTNSAAVIATVASGLTQYRPYQLITNNSTSGYLRLPAEL